MPSSILLPPVENDKLLLRVINDSWKETKEKSGKLLACRPGCTECCFGPFPINQLDAWRLREGMAKLSWLKATAVRLRAGGAWRRMKDRFPGNGETGLFYDEGAQEFGTRYANEPCPVLDPRTGLCELYEYRPVNCRTFGPPTRIDGENMPPCRLCYRGASTAKIEAYRVEIDPDQIEDGILTDLEQAGGPIGQTLIAFVLK